MPIRHSLALVAFATLAACSAPAPVVTNANQNGVTLTSTKSFGSDFPSNQEVRVAAQTACEQFGRNAGPLQQGNATDKQRTYQFTCIER